MRRTQLDTSVLKTENSVSNPSGIPFPDGLETELSVSNFDFFCSACRDTKKCVATQPQLPCSFRVATPRAMSRHPHGCPCHDMEIMSRPKTSLVQLQPCRDTRIDVTTWDPEKTRSRAQRPCRGRALQRAQPLGRARIRSYHACATPSLSQHHLLCRDLEPKMGSSPFQFLLCFLFLFFCKTTRNQPHSYKAVLKISVSTYISVLGFYGYIRDISMDIFS